MFPDALTDTCMDEQDKNSMPPGHTMSGGDIKTQQSKHNQAPVFDESAVGLLVSAFSAAARASSSA